jgi:VanZ family protein
MHLDSKRYYTLAFCWAGFILFATLATGGTLHRFHLSDLFAYDKPIHMFLFGMQAWLLYKAMSQHIIHISKAKIIKWASAISMSYGVITEFLQGWFVLFGRTFDYADMIADAIGCAIVYLYVIKKLR